MSTSSTRRHHNGKQLGSVEPLKDRGEYSLVLDFVKAAAKLKYTPYLLIVSTTDKGLMKPWSIPTDFWTLGSFVRRRSLDGS